MCAHQFCRSGSQFCKANRTHNIQHKGSVSSASRTKRWVCCRTFSPSWPLLLISLCQGLPFTLTHSRISCFYPLLLIFSHFSASSHSSLCSKTRSFPTLHCEAVQSFLSSSKPAAQCRGGLEKKLSTVRWGKFGPILAVPDFSVLSLTAE